MARFDEIGPEAARAFTTSPRPPVGPAPISVETLETLAAYFDSPPVAVPREAANLAESLMRYFERDPNLLLQLGWTPYDVRKVAGARYAISKAIEQSYETERP